MISGNMNEPAGYWAQPRLLRFSESRAREAGIECAGLAMVECRRPSLVV